MISTETQIAISVPKLDRRSEYRNASSHLSTETRSRSGYRNGRWRFLDLVPDRTSTGIFSGASLLRTSTPSDRDRGPSCRDLQDRRVRRRIEIAAHRIGEYGCALRERICS